MAEYPEQSGIVRTVTAAAEIPANRFVTAAGALTATSGVPLGISVIAGVTGEEIPIDTSGVRHVLVGTIPVVQGTEVACYANGLVGPLGSGGVKAGVAVESAASATLALVKLL